jgi:hypothetical protein
MVGKVHFARNNESIDFKSQPEKRKKEISGVQCRGGRVVRV